MINNIFIASKKYIKDPSYRFQFNAGMGLYRTMPDEEYLQKLYISIMGQNVDFENPVTFNEKIQWLKLHYRNPAYTSMVDKYRVKTFMSQLIGDDHIIPNIGVWDSPEHIRFEALPNQFVLKCNHNSGNGMIICKNKNVLDINKTRRSVRKGFCEDYYGLKREWPYKNVKRKIIAEQFMTDTTQKNGLTDYKIHCFNGIPKIILICKDRFISTGLTEDFVDTDWNRLEIKREKHGWSKELPNRPKTLKDMLLIAEKVAKGIPFIRVDFYEIQNKLLFGELTFFPASGFEKYVPEDWDYKLGEMLDIKHYKDDLSMNILANMISRGGY